MNVRSSYIAAAASVLFLSACQTERPAVSVEQAKRVTADFQGSSFTPPPRTIEDLTAILDSQPPPDPAEVERHRAEADRAPAPGLGDDARAESLYARATAALDIGRFKQALEDLREAKRLTERRRDQFRIDLLWQLANLEAYGGNHRDTARLREQALELVPRNTGQRLNKTAFLGFSQAAIGELDKAEATIAEAERLLRNAQSRPSAARFGHLWAAQVEFAKAIYNLNAGRYKAAEDLFHAALSDATAYDSAKKKGGLFQVRLLMGRNLAQTLLHEGKLVEAEVEARRVVTDAVAVFGRYSQYSALHLRMLLRTMAEQGRFAESMILARAIIEIYERLGVAEDAAFYNQARRQLADLYALQQNWTDAQREYDRIRRIFADDPKTYRSIFRYSNLAVLTAIKTGHAAAALAEAKSDADRTRRDLGAKHFDTAMRQGILAVAESATGNRAAALADFAEAIPILLSSSRQTVGDADSANSAVGIAVNAILAEYISLLSAVRGTELETSRKLDAVAEAFRVADAARSRAVQGSLAASGARAAARNPDLADLARREQDARHQIAALYALLANALSVAESQRDAAAIVALRKRIDELRGARAALAEEIERRYPAYADLVNPKPATVEQTRAALNDGEALIAMYVGTDSTLVWAVPKQGAVAYAAVPLGHDQLAAAVADLRHALDPKARTLGEIPAFDIRLSGRLYNALLEPVSAGWRNARSLLIVAHGPLAQLPLSTLVTRAADLAAESGALFSNYRQIPWLVRSHSVTALPSVASLVGLRASPSSVRPRRSFAGFGDPYFSAEQARAGSLPAKTAKLSSRGAFDVRGVAVSLRSAPRTKALASAELGALPRLPDTRDEVASIATALNADPARDVFVGERATEDAVKSLDLESYRVIAFATHGLVPGDLNGLIEPALALTSPALGGTKEDGLLTLGEILGLRLDADWVVLSACNTAAADAAGSEAFSGLGRAFFYAGTRALLLSNWPVETTSARALTTDLFRRQAADPALTRAEALRAAMVGLIDGDGLVDKASGRVVYSYAHPIFWAPFTLVGDGGGPPAASSASNSAAATRR